MANTYSKIYLQIVFAVKYREGLISKSWKQELYGFIGNTINAKGHKTFIVNGVEDHLHILLSLTPTQSISDLVRDVKRSSSLFINEQKLVRGKFAWQEGYGVFSYSPSHVDRVHKYIQNQETHHQKRTFKAEYLELLNRFEIDFDDRYVFEFFE